MANVLCAAACLIGSAAGAQDGNSTAHSYATMFSISESPLSEGGQWINGGAEGRDWADVRATAGLAFGAALPSRYADPTAVLVGPWGVNQQAEATVSVRVLQETCCREVELRLRTTIAPHLITGYEILCSVAHRAPYMEIVRWNGRVGDFTYLARTSVGCADGDLLKATTIGDAITVYKNGAQVLTVRDTRFGEGSPGIGFYLRTTGLAKFFEGERWQEFGFLRFEARDLP